MKEEKKKYHFEDRREELLNNLREINSKINSKEGIIKIILTNPKKFKEIVIK